MPAGLSETNSTICPDCGSLIIGDFCARCGYIKTSDVLDDKPLVEEAVKRNSIFEAPISKNQKKFHEELKKKMPKSKYFFIFFLFLLLSGLCSYYYWLYQSTTEVFLAPTPEFIIANSDDGLLVDVDEGGQTIIDFNIDVAEGNFLQYNLAQFAAPEVGIFMQMFGTYDYLTKFYEETLTAKYFKDLGIVEDDLNVYLAPSFAIVLPDDNFDRWGYASVVVDKEYIDKKIEALEKLRVKDKAYENLFARVVTIRTEKPVAEEAEVEENINESTTETTSAEEATTENKDESDEETTAESGVVETHYLLIANSKEYLDQMKEVSEGVLPNLGNSALFAQAQKELPAIGNALIYHNRQVDFSTEFYPWFASKFDYEGLDKLLDNVESSTLVLYSQSEKLKIAGISDL